MIFLRIHRLQSCYEFSKSNVYFESFNHFHSTLKEMNSFLPQAEIGEQVYVFIFCILTKYEFITR